MARLDSVEIENVARIVVDAVNEVVVLVVEYRKQSRYCFVVAVVALDSIHHSDSGMKPKEIVDKPFVTRRSERKGSGAVGSKLAMMK